MGHGTISRVRIVCRSLGTGTTPYINSGLRVNSSDYWLTLDNLTSTFDDYQGPGSGGYTVHPDTGNAFTWDEIDALEFGFRHGGGTGDETVDTTQCYLVVEYTGAYWRDGSPDNGTDFRFTERADIALKNYLANFSPTSSGYHADLTDYLQSKSVTYMTHDPLDVASDMGQTQTKAPLAYVQTVSIQPRRDVNSQGIALDARTRVILYTQDARPEVATKEWWAVAGAMMSLIEQTQDAPNNPEWACQFANWDHPEIPEPVSPEYQEEGDEANWVRGEFEVAWTHLEDM